MLMRRLFVFLCFLIVSTITVAKFDVKREEIASIITKSDYVGELKIKTAELFFPLQHDTKLTTLKAINLGKCKQLPLIILFPSKVDTALKLRYTARGIAANGYVTAVVNPASASNVNSVINQIVNSTIKPYVQSDAIGIIGAAEFGAVGVSLAGGKLSQEAKKLFTQHEKILASLLAAKRDKRVKAVLLLSPGYAWAFAQQSLKLIKVPLFIIYGHNEPFTQNVHAVYYANNIPTAGIFVLPNARLQPVTWQPPIEIANLPKLPLNLAPRTEKILIRMAVEFFGKIINPGC